MKKLTKILSLALVTVFCVLALASCVNVYLDQVITINSDFSGTRTLSLYLGAYPTNSDNDKVVGYYWINIHGEELRAYLENLYKNDPATSQYNYTITVDDSTLVPTYKADGVTPDPTKMFVAGDEIITISFDYTDFNDYCAKLKALGSFNGGCVERSTKPEHAGLITWVPEEKAGEFVYI